MSEPIKVGDLVMVVRGHSCVMKEVGGKIFVVIEMQHPYGGGWQCPRCYMLNAGPNEPAASNGRGTAIPLSWLKKLDPPAQPESIERVEEISA